MALGKQLIALHIDIQKNYKVKIILNDVKFMKVPYVNRTDRNQKYHLKSSDKDVMEVREDAVEILKNSRGILPVKFGPISAIGVRKVHLLIEKEAGETDCIEFEV